MHGETIKIKCEFMFSGVTREGICKLHFVENL